MSEKYGTLLAKTWRAKAESIRSQLRFVNSWPEAPVREADTLVLCASEIEAAEKDSAIDAVIHLSNIRAGIKLKSENDLEDYIKVT